MEYGVYGIYYKNILLYVGSTDCFDRRWKEHIRDLAKGKHSNKTLQKYVNANVKDLNELEFRVVHVTLDNSKIRLFFSEMICILIYKPKCNRAVFQIGLKYVSLGKPSVGFDDEILKYL